MITPRDHADLDWFFSAGLASQERSTCGPMLDRARTFAVPRTVDPEVAHARSLRVREGRFDEPVPGELTARPTAEVREAGRSEPEHNDLVRYGRVSRRLARMPAQHREVWAAYFGDVAARWARESGMIGRIGRLGPVLALTEAGRKLIDRERRKARGAKLDVTALARIENAVAREDLQSEAPTKTLIETALDEAREALAKAAEAWGETG